MVLFVLVFIYCFLRECLTGSKCNKLDNVDFEFRNKLKKSNMGEWGDFTVLNVFSRASGQMREWDNADDNHTFSEQYIDG